MSSEPLSALETPLAETRDTAFAEEVARLRQAGALGEAGRLRELFDFLAARDPDRPSASQAEIAEEVFGQVDSDGDDATVRVYVHRLRKRLEQFYEGEEGDPPNGRLTIPAGAYALRLIVPQQARLGRIRRSMALTWTLVAALVFATVLAFLAGNWWSGGGDRPAVNAIWQPFIDSDRPILVVVGDYYMFGEIDRLEPETGRLIRDFQVNSPTDLARAQATDPDRYGGATDVGLTYLPLSSADALRSLMPVLARDDKPVRIVAASQLHSDELGDYNVVYIGLLSGMGLLEDVSFMNSNFAIGETYDELVHLPSGGHFVSGEAQSLPSPGYYADYGYLAVYREPGGGLVAVVAGARDTALRAISPMVTGGNLPDALEREARGAGDSGFEALFEITGQQGAGLSERLVLTGQRPDR